MLGGSASNSCTSETRLLQEIHEYPPDERLLKVEQYLSAHIARILAASPESIDADRPLSDLGFDSLMLVELALIVQDDLGPRISSASVSPAVSIKAFAQAVAGSLESASNWIGPSWARLSGGSLTIRFRRESGVWSGGARDQ